MMDVVYHGCIRGLVCTGPSSSKSIDGEAFTRGKPTLSCLSCLLFKQRNWCINCSVNILSMFSSVSKGFLRSLPTFLSACPEKKGQFSAKSSHGPAYALSPVLYRIALGSEVVQSHFHFKLSIPSSHRRDPTQNADSHDPIFPFSIRSLLAPQRVPFSYSFSGAPMSRRRGIFIEHCSLSTGNLDAVPAIRSQFYCITSMVRNP